MARQPRSAQGGLRVVRSKGPAAQRTGRIWRETDAVFIRIGEPLCRLLGREGYRALLERALYVAAEDYPLLKTVRPAIAPAGRLVGLPPVDALAQHERVFQALAATLAVLLALLVRLLGSDLVQQILGGDTADEADTVRGEELLGDATA